MIISHRLRFIHLKCIKAGGSSFEAAMSAHAGPSDIVTPISPEPEPRPDGSRHTPRNASGLRGHTPWMEARDLVGDDVWNQYLKVCIVRNPWDQAISRMFHQNPGLQDLDLAQQRLTEMLRALADRQAPGQLGPGERIFMTADGTPVVDRVLRFESLQHDTDRLCTDLGCDRTPLPRLKSVARSNAGNAAHCHTPETAELTALLWQATIRHYGYTPPEPCELPLGS